ncbi:MAG: fluoride efflux transporter CrcB [Deltaproteobacteria bacterium]|nr:fluoride efflux transporter CrcB [Deltaproteobacteria bacterium]
MLRSLHPILINILMVMVGGSLGALSRYGFALMAGRFIGARFPWGTLMANLVGCFLIGVAFALVERTNLLSPSARLFIMTGFLGSLTTFSTYALETVVSVRGETVSIAFLNFFLNNALGLVLVLSGMWIVRLIRP